MGTLCALAGLTACVGEFSLPAGPGGPANAEGAAADGAIGADGTGGPTDGVAGCDAREVPGQPLRRLSSAQYHNTLRDLLGPALAETLVAGSLFPQTVVERGFANDAEANVVNTAESHAIEDNAERIAAAVIADPDAFLSLMPCPDVSSSDPSSVDGCVDAFIASFGARAYRRPVSDGETTVVRSLYDRVRQDGSAVEAFSALMQLFVQAPALLYRVERGAEEVLPGLVRLSDHEMASRISYFFADTMPDAELFTEAEAGRLRTPDQVAAQARRLIGAPTFHRVLEGFHRDWLHVYSLASGGKDTGVFPQYNAQLRDSLLEEVGRFVQNVLERGDGSVRSLLGSSEGMVDPALAELYALAPVDDWTAVDLPERRGVLTLASVMAAQASASQTDPIHRGLFVQEEVLCNDLPSLPVDVDTMTALDDVSGLPTARERLQPLLTDPSCSGCHSQFNPTGLALENYDALGQWREFENDAPILSAGTLTLDTVPVEFGGPLEMMDSIAASDQARDCYTRQWFRASLGRREAVADRCSLDVATRAAADSDGDIVELLVAIATSDAFMYRSVEDLQP